MKINIIKPIKYFIWFVVSVLFIQNQGIASTEEPNPQLVKKYADMMAETKTLSLRSKGVGNQEIKAIAEALKDNKTLTGLGLSNNPISAEGAKDLAEALKVNNRLTWVNLTDNRIGDEGARALAEALKVNKTLANLTLWQPNR